MKRRNFIKLAGSGLGVFGWPQRAWPGVRAQQVKTVRGPIPARKLGCTLVHRVGTLRPGAAIVLVLAAAAHRQAALDGTSFLIDWLKISAPFWKKEHFAGGGAAWVAARAEDDIAAARWGA